jgi:hypothetical protein
VSPPDGVIRCGARGLRSRKRGGGSVSTSTIGEAGKIGEAGMCRRPRLKRGSRALPPKTPGQMRVCKKQIFLTGRGKLGCSLMVNARKIIARTPVAKPVSATTSV